MKKIWLIHSYAYSLYIMFSSNCISNHWPNFNWCKTWGYPIYLEGIYFDLFEFDRWAPICSLIALTLDFSRLKPWRIWIHETKCNVLFSMIFLDMSYCKSMTANLFHVGLVYALRGLCALYGFMLRWEKGILHTYPPIEIWNPLYWTRFSSFFLIFCKKNMSHQRTQ